ncbi:MAG: molybdopterin oxidoreductase family protein [Chitinivorax sp.]
MSATTHHRACNLCEAICGLEIQLEGEQIVSIKGDKNDPLSRGHICPKAVALQDLQTDPDRLRTPLRRVGNAWQEISWDDAFELVASKLAEVREQYGADAIATYQGNPNVHNYGLMTHGGQLLGLLKTRNRFSATSVDQLPHQLMVYWMYGHQLLVPIPDIDHTDYLLMLGANPIASNGSLMTVPDVAKRIKALQARGGRLVVIDPRRTETAQVADVHHFIRPGSDAALLLALLNVLFAEGLTKPGRLQNMLDQPLETIHELVAPFTPEAVAAQTGIDADAIKTIARDFAAAPRAVAYGRMGCSTQIHGTICQWAIQALNIVTGNLDTVGGSLATKPALDLLGAPGSKPGSYGRVKSRVSGRPEANGELPVAVMAEEILTPGEGQIKALVCIAGNPVLSTPNGRQLEQALQQLDFMVSLDVYLNETSQYADVILPTTTPLEHDHFDMIFNIFAVRNYARYSEAVLPKPEGAKHDWEILTQLGERLAAKLGVAPKPAPSPEMMLDFGLQMGPWGMATETQLTLAKLKANPSGIDLGALTPSFPERLFTADKKIHLLPEPVKAAIEAARAELLAQPAAGQLLLIGRRHVRSNNSWMHNSHRLTKGPQRTALLMHPDDLAQRQLFDGQPVRVTSRVGSVDIEVCASADMMPGTVSLPHGWGHHRPGARLSVARNTPGASVNDLTDDQLLDPVCGVAALNGVPVSVEALT